MSGSDYHKNTAVILTALEIETRAVLRQLNGFNDDTVSGTCFFKGTFGDWEVAVAEVGPGNVGATAIAVRALEHYKPSVALFVGVAGGVKDVSLGDVVVATKIYLYESGKDRSAGFQPRPVVLTTAHDLEQRARFLRQREDWKKRTDQTNNSESAKVFIGAIAAGEKVVASKRSITARLIRGIYSDTLAVEMEGCGFLEGVRINHMVRGCVIRGISDLLSGKANADKVGWQKQAADNASAVAFEILSSFSGRPASLPDKVITKRTEELGYTEISDSASARIDAEGRTRKGNVYAAVRAIPLLPEMVLIPPGKFTMGISEEESIRQKTTESDANARPLRTVTICRSFWIGKYPITNAEYKIFQEETGHKTSGRYVLSYNPEPSHPVINIKYRDAIAYIEWINTKTSEEYRLPSESEWEYVARSGTTTARHWGDSAFGADEFAAVGLDATIPVGSFAPNAFGVYDMLGNVWEITSDLWHPNYDNAPTNGDAWIEAGEDKKRPIRGGAWSSNVKNLRCGVRVMTEDWFPGYLDNGFRLVKNADLRRSTSGSQREELT